MPSDKVRLDWLDAHCSFVADQEFNIGPFKIGELRKMADAGIALTPPAQEETPCEKCGHWALGVCAMAGPKTSPCKGFAPAPSAKPEPRT